MNANNVFNDICLWQLTFKIAGCQVLKSQYDVKPVLT